MKNKHLCRKILLFIIPILVGAICSYITCKTLTAKEWKIDESNMLEVSKVMIGLCGTVLGFIITAESILIAFDSGSITSEFKKTGHYMTVIFQYTQTSIKLLISVVVFVIVIVVNKISMCIFAILIGLTVMNFMDVFISLGILYFMMRMANS